MMNRNLSNNEEEMHSTERVLRMTMNRVHAEGRKVSRKPVKRISIMIAAVLILTLSVGTAFATEIRDFVTAHLSIEGGTPAPLADIGYVNIGGNVISFDGFEEPGKQMTVSEAQNMLDIDLLTYQGATTEELSYSSYLSEDKIGRIDLWYAGFVEYPNSVPEESSNYKRISESMNFLTQYADERYWSAFEEGVDAQGGKDALRTHHIKSIDTDAIIYGADWDETRLTATFIYENVMYTFIANNVSEAEMIEILENLT
jgi:hypothetical protein